MNGEVRGIERQRQATIGGRARAAIIDSPNDVLTLAPKEVVLEIDAPCAAIFAKNIVAFVLFVGKLKGGVGMRRKFVVPNTLNEASR